MIRCSRCVMPDTRPDTAFVDGVCSACISYEKRPTIDWKAREEELRVLLARHENACIVPSSGGKDSTYQVLKLRELGAKVLIVTASTCHITPIGRANIDNLGRFANTIEMSTNKTVRAKLNRIGLEQVGDISWPEHVSIFTTPFHAASLLGVPLIFYGENPQNQYGGPMGSDEAQQLTRRWRSEFGGFLGMRPSDLVGKDGLTEVDLSPYILPDEEDLVGVEAHFLGQYIPWDSHRNAEASKAAGMRQQLPCEANFWEHENLDNAQTGIHDQGMYRKFGFGRGCAQIAVDVRTGRVSRDYALNWVKAKDGLFPTVYGGVHVREICDRLEITTVELSQHLNAFTNWKLFDENQDLRRPVRAI